MYQPGSLENAMANNLFSQNQERTFIDKVLAKNEIEEIKELMEKETLDRKDLGRLTYLIGAVEIKLVNLGEWERYILGKYFAWLRDFISTLEMEYDYYDKIATNEIEVNEETKRMATNAHNLLIHNTKASIDLFFYLARSTLSLGNTAFDTLTTSRFEYAYPSAPQPQGEEKKSFSNILPSRSR